MVISVSVKAVKQFVIDAVVAFIFYTATLTPYMLFIVKTTFDQYLTWLVMQAILVPPLGAIFAMIVRKIKLRG
jgi:hypothetical protein